MSMASLSKTEAVAGSPCPPTLEEEHQELAFAVLRLERKGKGSKLRASVRGVYSTEEEAYTVAAQSLISELEAAIGGLRKIAFEKSDLTARQRLRAIAATYQKICSSSHRLKFTLQKTRLYGRVSLGEIAKPLPCQREEDEEDENDEDYEYSDENDDVDYDSDVDDDVDDDELEELLKGKRQKIG